MLPCSILTGPIYICDAEPGDVLQVSQRRPASSA